MTRPPPRPWTHPALRTLAVLWTAGSPLPTSAQLEVRGYALGVAAHTGTAPATEAGATLLGRTRLTATARAGALELEVAYEHVLTRSATITAPVFVGVGTTQHDWLGATWEIAANGRTAWIHRLDRASLAWAGGPLEVVLGRQTISWATTLFMTPADPFQPFDPSDPFREYRGGVDALRVRLFTGAFTEIETVIRPLESPRGTTWTALARAQTSVGGWWVGAWGGSLHEDAAGAVFASGAVGATAARAELSVRRDDAGARAVRGTVGLDRYEVVAGRDLSLVVELQYDGFGWSSAQRIADVTHTAAFARGEMQTLARWTVAARAGYQLHPLIAADLLTLLSPERTSVLLASGLAWSASSSISVRLGLFRSFGPGGVDASGSPRSEYGPTPGVVYLALSAYF